MFELLKSNLCDKLKTNLCDSPALLFSEFASIASMLIFAQWLIDLVFYCIMIQKFIMLHDRINFTHQIIVSIFGSIKVKSLGSVVIMSLIYSMCAPNIIKTWLNCCRVFWRFYHVDMKDIVLVWYVLFVYLNYFQFLFVLMILEVWLIVYLELRFLILFLFLLSHHHLLVTWLVNLQLVLRHFLVILQHFLVVLQSLFFLAFKFKRIKNIFSVAYISTIQFLY